MKAKKPQSTKENKMKKLLSLISLLLICAVLFGCNNNSTSTQTEATSQNTGSSSTTQAAHSTPSSTTAPDTGSTEEVKKPDLYPAKPDGLTEKVLYDYGENGLAITKQYYDKEGRCLEEHVYELDDELCIFFPSIIIKWNYDKNGMQESAEIEYSSHPVHGIPKRNITFRKSSGNEHDYDVLNSDGKVILYVDETPFPVHGGTAKIELYARNGKPAGTMKMEYDKNGVRTSLENYDAEGVLLYSCTYGENGNLLSAKKYSGEGVVTQELSAEYLENGTLSKCALKKFDISGKLYSNQPMLFKDDGSLYEYKGIRCSSVNGIPNQSFSYSLTYNFDDQGYVVTCEKRTNSGSIVYTNYTYDTQGRIKTRSDRYNSGSAVKTDKYSYTYEPDGSYTMEYTNGNGVLTNVLKVNSMGLITWDAELNRNGLIGKETYSYDSFGALTSYREYNGETLIYYENHTYDEKGNVTESILCNVKDNYTYRATYEYFSDGGYKVTEYKDIYGEYTETTYNASGKVAKISVNSGGSLKTTVYEYFSDGTLASATSSKDGKTISMTAYNADGSIHKVMILDTDGAPIFTEYIRENGVPVRINTYEGSTLTEYAELEYFSYTSDDENCPKNVKLYKADGTLIGLSEYAMLKIEETGEELCLLVKEETYENGETVAYTLIEYSPKNGNATLIKAMISGILTEISYDGDSTEEKDMLYKKIYVNGVLLSVYERVEDTSPPRFAETTYNANGKPVKKILYSYFDSHVDETYTYEYFESGALKKETFKTEWDLKETEYDEQGNKIKYKVEEYDSSGAVHQGSTSHYDSNGNLIRLELQESSLIYHDTVYTYDENGKLSKSVKNYYYKGNLGSVTQTTYDENEKDVYIRFEVPSTGSITETFNTYNENGELTYSKVVKDGVITSEARNTYSESGTLIKEESYTYGDTPTTYISEYTESGKPLYTYNVNRQGYISETTYTYNEKELLLQKISLLNGSERSKEIYAYHENGTVSMHAIYINGKLSSELYYDENGVVIIPEQN